jgi:hypothetical protein
VVRVSPLKHAHTKGKESHMIRTTITALLLTAVTMVALATASAKLGMTVPLKRTITPKCAARQGNHRPTGACNTALHHPTQPDMGGDVLLGRR